MATLSLALLEDNEYEALNAGLPLLCIEPVTYEDVIELLLQLLVPVVLPIWEPVNDAVIPVTEIWLGNWLLSMLPL